MMYAQIIKHDKKWVLLYGTTFTKLKTVMYYQTKKQAVNALEKFCQQYDEIEYSVHKSNGKLDYQGIQKICRPQRTEILASKLLQQ